MNIYLLSVVFCLVFLFIVIELIRRQKVAERYALLWLLLGVLMLVLSLFPDLMNYTAEKLGVKYEPSLLFIMGILFSLVLIMHLTIVISKLHRKITRLIQEVALLQKRMEEMSGQSGERGN